jgi:hypothetical protein
MQHAMRGASQLGCLVSLIVVAAVVYAGFKWGYAQWDYEAMKEELTDAAKFWSTQTNIAPEPVALDVIRRAAAIGLELYAEDIEVAIQPGSLTISVFWEAPLQFPGYTYYIPYHLTRTVAR